MAAAVDVVMLSYGRYDLTKSCLRHLAAQTINHRVIIVDNGSTDDAPDRIAAEWPEHTLIRHRENGPFAARANEGVAAGSAEIIVLMNNDVDCRPEFLERIVEPLMTNPQVASVAGLMLQPGAERIDSIGLTIDSTLAGYPRLQWQPATHASDPAPVFVGPAGTAAAYRRAAWDAVGGLDERIYAYNEDLDLALRLSAAGWDTAAAPTAVGIHLGSATHGHRSAWQRSHGGFSRAYLLRRYGVLRSRAGVRAIVIEAAVCVGDAWISRDLVATKSRLRGWRAARGLPRHRAPARAHVDSSITLRKALALRRSVYALPR